MRLDYSSIEIIKEILAAKEISINDLCEKLSISRRMFYYRFDKLNDWLAENGFDSVRNRRSHGLSFSEIEKPAIQDRLASIADSVYELSGDERRSNILLLLLTAHDDVFITTINALNRVSRNTTLDDLRQLEQELRRSNRVELHFQTKTGYFIDGTSLNKRLCLFYFLQRSLKYKNNFLENAITRVLEENRDRTERTADELSSLVLDVLQRAQQWLGRRFTDKDSHLLRYALLVFCVDVARGSEAVFDDRQRHYLCGTPEFAAARDLRGILGDGLRRDIPPEEDYFLALLLLVAKSHALAPGKTRADRRLLKTIQTMVAVFQKISGFRCYELERLVAQLFSHLRPAIHRCLFSISLDNILRDDIAEKYPRLLETSRQAVTLLEREYEIRLSDDELGYIAIMFGAHLTPEKLQAERRVLLVTEGGIASTMMLEKQLRELSILPLDLVSCSFSELLSSPFPKDVDLIVTTASLPIGFHSEIAALKVKHILSASERHLVRDLIEGYHKDRPVDALVTSIMDVVGANMTVEESAVVSGKITELVNQFVGNGHSP